MALALGLLAGLAVFLMFSPGRRPDRPSALVRVYARLGARPIAVVSSATGPWVRRLPLQPLVLWLLPLVHDPYRRRVERLLTVSRLARTHTLCDILAMKLALCLGLWVYGLLSMMKRADALVLGLVVLMSLIGFFYPDMWLGRKAQARQRRIRSELPSVLSAIAVSLESGRHLMPSIAEVTHNRDGVLIDELRHVVDRYERRMPAATLLDELAREVEVPELTIVLAGLVQAFDKGAGHVVETVRNQATDAWDKRKRRAESLAQTASLKLFLPLLLLSIPGLMIFMVGPAMVELMRFFSR